MCCLFISVVAIFIFLAQLIPRNSFACSGFVLQVRTKCAAGKAISWLGSERQCQMHRRFSILCLNCVAPSSAAHFYHCYYYCYLRLRSFGFLLQARYQSIGSICCGIHCHKFILIPPVTTHLYLCRGLLRINRCYHRWELLYVKLCILCLLAGIMICVFAHNPAFLFHIGA